MPHKTKIGVVAAYFENVVMQHTSDDCLIWPFTRNNMGYGRLGDGYAHIEVCKRVHGPRPKDHDAAHRCGRGHLGCVSLSHIRWRTRSQNMMEAGDHGTLRTGTKSHFAKLRVEQVQKIFDLKRAGGLNQREIADEMGVSPALVCIILKGKVWKRVLPQQCAAGAAP